MYLVKLDDICETLDSTNAIWLDLDSPNFVTDGDDIILLERHAVELKLMFKGHTLEEIKVICDMVGVKSVSG